MTSAAGSDGRTAAALAARRRRTDAMLGRVTDAIHQLQREHRRVSFAAIARRADVSRTFLYENANTRKQIQDAIDRRDSRRRTHNGDLAGVEQPWRERARNAEDALKTAHAEIRHQRATIAELLGRIRDLEADEARHTIGGLSADNTGLRQRVRELTAQNRTLEERLQAARSNARFLDKRIADLEASILQQSATLGAAR
jgi:chromosome segregation ATPase